MEMDILVILMVAFALFAILMFVLFYIYAKKYYNEKHLTEIYEDDAVDDELLEKKEPIENNNVDIDENDLIKEKDNVTNDFSSEIAVEEDFVPIKKNSTM